MAASGPSRGHARLRVGDNINRAPCSRETRTGPFEIILRHYALSSLSFSFLYPVLDFARGPMGVSARRSALSGWVLIETSCVGTRSIAC